MSNLLSWLVTVNHDLKITVSKSGCDNGGSRKTDRGSKNNKNHGYWRLQKVHMANNDYDAG